MFARHSPRVHTQAVTSLPAQTAPRVPLEKPADSRLLAMRQDRVPTSSKLCLRSSWI